MRGPWRPPAGWTIEYEFRPSLIWYPSIHNVHAFWKRENPDKEPRLFWWLKTEEQKEWERQYLQAMYRRYTGRKHWECAWQRFTVTDINGKKIVLQMDNQGRVVQLKEVEITQKVWVAA